MLEPTNSPLWMALDELLEGQQLVARGFRRSVAHGSRIGLCSDDLAFEGDEASSDAEQALLDGLEVPEDILDERWCHHATLPSLWLFLVGGQRGRLASRRP